MSVLEDQNAHAERRRGCQEIGEDARERDERRLERHEE